MDLTGGVVGVERRDAVRVLIDADAGRDLEHLLVDGDVELGVNVGLECLLRQERDLRRGGPGRERPRRGGATGAGVRAGLS